MHVCSVLPVVTPRSLFSPEIFAMREMVDSKDLHKMAAFVLVFVTAVTPPIDIVKPLIESLLKTLRESPVGLPCPFIRCCQAYPYFQSLGKFDCTRYQS